MRCGIKRFIVLLMFVATPVAFSQIISPIQDTPILATDLYFGKASWYSESDPYINVHTANGEVFDDSQRTCASWDFRFNTYLKVTNLTNGKSVVCRVNDRGPAKRLNRLIDLTKSAFREVAPLGLGLIEVSVLPIESGHREI